MLHGMIESHTHASMVPFDGFQAMAANGISKAVSCGIVISARHAESYFDHFRMISGFYRQVAASAGVDLYSAVGIHPVGIPEDWTRVIERLPEFLQEDTVVAIGEAGMNQGSQLEKDVLQAQLEVARDCKVPAIIHTPKENRPFIVDKILNIAVKVGLAPGLLIIDHANLDIIKQIHDFGAVPGLTIRPQNITPEVLVENLDLFSNGMLNSDYSNIMPNNPISFLKAVEYMLSQEVDINIIKSLSGGKASSVYGLLD